MIKADGVEDSTCKYDNLRLHWERTLSRWIYEWRIEMYSREAVSDNFKCFLSKCQS